MSSFGGGLAARQAAPHDLLCQVHHVLAAGQPHSQVLPLLRRNWRGPMMEPHAMLAPLPASPYFEQPRAAGACGWG